MAARVKAAAAGKAELVRFPMVHRDSWGSNFPTYFVGLALESAPGEGCPCLTPKFAKGAEEPDTFGPDGRDNGRLAVVEGRFTGKTSTTKQSDDPEETATYTLYEFEVLRHRALRNGEGANEKVQLIATPEQLADSPPRLIDDKPWIATVDSFSLFKKGEHEKALALKAKVEKSNVGHAELLDSRTAALLFCCYEVVIAGRFATQDEATALMKELKKKGFTSAGVRRGW